MGVGLGCGVGVLVGRGVGVGRGVAVGRGVGLGMVTRVGDGRGVAVGATVAVAVAAPTVGVTTSVASGSSELQAIAATMATDSASNAASTQVRAGELLRVKRRLRSINRWANVGKSLLHNHNRGALASTTDSNIANRGINSQSLGARSIGNRKPPQPSDSCALPSFKPTPIPVRRVLTSSLGEPPEVPRTYLARSITVGAPPPCTTLEAAAIYPATTFS